MRGIEQCIDRGETSIEQENKFFEREKKSIVICIARESKLVEGWERENKCSRWKIIALREKVSA
jgi:hypothetical protein